MYKRFENLVGAPLVCARVNDLVTPKVPSHKEPCERCREPIWCAIDSPQEATKICVQCALILRGPTEKEQPTRPAISYFLVGDSPPHPANSNSGCQPQLSSEEREMPSAAKYRSKALELLLLADLENNPRIKAEFENMASAFLHFAEQADRGGSLQ